jgi:predicted transposase/invertase (TIGR01784 family)
LWHDQEHSKQYHWYFQVCDEQQTSVVLTPHLAIHVLELPKFRATADELDSPMDRWLYFFQHAKDLDLQNLPEKLRGTEVHQALEELDMLSKDQFERESYEARLRIQRDETSRAKYIESLKFDREAVYRDGIAEGLKEGLAKMIQRYQRGLKREVTVREELLALSLEQLQTLADQLEHEVFGEQAP